MKMRCIGVSQERRYVVEKKAEVTLSETYKFVPDTEVTVTEPQKESPGGNAQRSDPDGGKRVSIAHTTTIVIVTTDPKLFGKYVEDAPYEVTF